MTEYEAVADEVVGATGRSVNFFWSFFECIGVVGVFWFSSFWFYCVTVWFYVCGLGFLLFYVCGLGF